MDGSKEKLKQIYSNYQNLKTVGLDIIRSIQKYFENTDGIQELSYSKVSLNYTIMDVPFVVAVEFPAGFLPKRSGIIKTFYKLTDQDNNTPLEKEFIFDHLGNIEKTYTKEDFPAVYLQNVLDIIVQKLKIVPKP